jgi:lipopolysaccharide transport system ATP-binding protein
VLLNGAILGMSHKEIAAKFDEIVAFSGVERHIDTPVKHYSSGMYMRLAFSVSAHLDSEVLLVDEVLAVGDAAFQRKCLGKMSDVARDGRTVLFVSHNMSAVTSLCGRALWLEHGQIRQDDDAGTVVASYAASVGASQAGARGRVTFDTHRGRRKQFQDTVRMESCEVLARDGESQVAPRTGDPVRLRFGYSAPLTEEDALAEFVCIFRDSHLNRLAYCSSELPISHLEQGGAIGEIDCIIPALPLAPGTYVLDVGVKVGGMWADLLYEAVSFEVAEGGLFHGRRPPPPESGPVLLDYPWEPVARVGGTRPGSSRLVSADV